MRPNFAQCSARISATDCLRTARMFSHSSIAQSPSFSRTWSDPVPKLSSPQIVARAGVQQVAEELPPRRRLILRRSPAHPPPGPPPQRSASTAPRPSARPCIARRQMRIGRQHRQTVRGRDIDPAPDHHVAVAVAIADAAPKSGAASDRTSRPSAPWPRSGSGRGACRRNPAGACALTTVPCRRAQPVFQDLHRIGPGHGAHAIHPHPEAAREHRADRRESRTASPSARHSPPPDRPHRPPSPPS